jgi:serine protease inhibitor
MMITKISNPKLLNIIRNALSSLLVLSTCLVLSPCSEYPVSNPEEPFELTASQKALIESDNKFGLKLFQEVNEAEGDSNIFISPLSVAMALGMTYNGANGSTQEAMEQALELSGLSLEEINQSYGHLIDLLTGLDPKVQFDIANSIWYKITCPAPETDFLQQCQQYFGALVAGLDFSSPDAARTINAWVDESTHGKIDQIVDDPIDGAIRMFLINAIYFKGNWTYQFDETQTQEKPFLLLDGSAKTCQMMSQKAIHRYLFTADFQAADLPYGDGTYSMTLFLPQQTLDPDGLIAQLKPENLSHWLSQFSADSLNVHLPRFTLEYDRELKDDLTALGMGIAFTAGADFTKMFKSGGIWIDKVKHKTFVDVNEEGTEAAAVTDVEMVESIQPPTFQANRPFIFIIRENESGTILFIGKMVDPTMG